MASTSSLLRSAESTRQKVRDYEDALAAYEWQNSTKTYGDFVAYSRYLQDQQTSVSSPMDQLSYVKKIDAAQSGYISNEIQRQSIKVIEGGGTNIDKYNRMTELYYHAADAGQFDLAQSMRLQLDNLSVTIQNESRAALAANKEMASQVAKDIDIQVKDAIAQVQENTRLVIGEYSKLGPDQFQSEYGSDIFSLLANMVNSQDPNNPGLVQVYQQAAEATPDAAKIRDYQVKLNDLANEGSTGIKLPGVGDISYKDLSDQAFAQSVGQTLFEAVQTGKGVEFTKNQTTGFAWGRDENGNYSLMPVYNPKQNFESSIASKEKGKNKSYNDVLKDAGFEIIENGQGNIKVRNNGEFDNAGISRGQQVQLYVDLNGNLQLVNGQKAYALGFDQNTGNYTGISAYEANPINLLPSGDQRFSSFNNRFFAGKDLSSLPAGTVGLIDQTSPLARSMEAGPLARPQFNPQQAAPLQQPAPVNIQPTAPAPVQAAINPLGLPSSTRISIAKPLPLPNLKVTKPIPAPNVTVAAPAPQQQISGVGVAPSGGTLRVGF